MIKKGVSFSFLSFVLLLMVFEASADTGRIVETTGNSLWYNLFQGVSSNQQTDNNEYGQFEWYASKGLCLTDKIGAVKEGTTTFTSDQKKKCCTAVGEEVSVSFCVANKCTDRMTSKCTECDLGCKKSYVCSGGQCVAQTAANSGVSKSNEIASFEWYTSKGNRCFVDSKGTLSEGDSTFTSKPEASCCKNVGDEVSVSFCVANKCTDRMTSKCTECDLGCKKSYVCSDGKCIAEVQPISPTVQPNVAQPVSPVNPSIVQTCTDSDNGKDYYSKGKGVGLYSNNKQKGWVFGEDSNKTSSRYDSTIDYSMYYDHCFNSDTSNQLNEGYCDNNSLLSSIAYICPNGCKDGACVAQVQPSCVSDCSVVGAKQCSGSGYRVCGSYDSDSCLEWGSVTSCSSGEICSNGQCVVQTQSCSDTCSVNGAKQCSGSGYRVCGSYDSDSCLEWSSITSCSSGYTCSNGQCVAQTPAYTCVDSDGGKDYYVNGRLSYGSFVDYDNCLELTSQGYIMNDNCVSVNCYINEGFCDSTKSYSGMPLWFDQSFKCPNGCKDGACVAQSSCTSECSASGAKQCSGSGYRVCGSYDADSCLEWSSVTSCSSGEICSNGQCVVQPVSPVNPSIVQTCIDSDNGKDYYVKGSITAKNIPGTVYSDNSPSTSIYSTNSVLDACHGMDLGNGVFSELDELYCDNTNNVAVVTHLSCRNGCKDGACIV